MFVPESRPYRRHSLFLCSHLCHQKTLLLFPHRENRYIRRILWKLPLTVPGTRGVQTSKLQDLCILQHYKKILFFFMHWSEQVIPTSIQCKHITFTSCPKTTSQSFVLSSVVNLNSLNRISISNRSLATSWSFVTRVTNTIFRSST